ncbi:MAG: TonB-dependent receptor [Pseudomonadota bacterium]|nr:TonB-dependent receptor [Pseudomonadota bacterium]
MAAVSGHRVHFARVHFALPGLCLIGGALFGAAGIAQAEQPIRERTTNRYLETVQVTATPPQEALVESENDLQEALQTVPGGTNLVSLAQPQKISTLSDALNYQPGIIVQEFFGGLDQPRLNIRGSGIQGNPVSRGVLLRQNHLPLNDADGSFIIGLVNLRDTRMISVHRGANSRVPGSFTLGGDLNFITRQGSAPDQPEPTLRVGFEGGSFGQQMIHMGYDSGAERHSWHGSLTDEQAEGYRYHSASRRQQLHINLASQWTQQLSNYSYLSHTDMHFDMPFVLPEDTAESHPRWVFGDGVPVSGLLPDGIALPPFIDVDNVANQFLNMYRRDPHRSTEQLRLTNRTTYWHDHYEHSLGLYWQQTDDAFVDPFSHIDTDSETLGGLWTLDAQPTAYLHYQVGLDYSHSDMPRDYTGNHPFQGSPVEPAYARFDLEAENRAFSLLFDLDLLPQLTLNGQWQWGQAHRKAREQGGDAMDERWTFSLPKLGLIYRPDSYAWRSFLNLSKSIELPTFWEIVGVDINPLLTWMSDAYVQSIEPQTAVTLEWGIDQKLAADRYWELVLYHSRIEDELISTASQFGVIATTENYAGDTVHQGIEAGFGGRWGKLIYRASWTYSDFYFAEGEFAGNRIAGVPENLIMLETLLQEGDFRFGPNLTWVPDDNPVDHANSLGQGAYALLGFNLRYQPNALLQGYCTVSNLLDEVYNASYVVRAQSSAELPTFLPGNGRSVVLGLQLSLR